MAAAGGAPDPGHTDEALVERVRERDGAAFETLYERYFARIYRFVDRRLADAAEVEESVEEVFTGLFASLDAFRGEVPFAAWVFGLARRVLANRFARKRGP